MLLIGLSYKARNGKTSVAQYMQEYDPKVRIFAFADELKFYCRDNHEELRREWFYAHPHASILKNPKDDPIYGYTQILQWYGSDVVRAQEPDKWIKSIDEILTVAKPEIAIIQDVRFPNEAQYIKEKGGYMVNVVRLKEDGTQYLDEGRDPSHISETALDNYEEWDFVIQHKEGELHDLKKKSIGVLNAIKYKDEGYWHFVSERDFSDDILQAIKDEGITSSSYDIELVLSGEDKSGWATLQPTSPNRST